MDQLGAMRMFVRVADAGSFAAVATQLDVARSVVTRQVAALERKLGTRLLARSTRSLTLTAAGQTYLEKCREILDLVDEADSELTEARREVRGHLRVSVPLSLGLSRLTAFIADFTRDHPHVEMELDLTDRRVDLISEGFDLALRVTAQLEDTAVARLLAHGRCAVVASSAYLERAGTPDHPRDLIRHECFGYVPAMRSRWPFVIDGRLQWFRTAGRLHANNGDALLEATVRGLGISYQPLFIAQDAIAAGTVRPILEDYPTRDLALYAVYPGNRYVPHPVRALVDHLASRIVEAPGWERPGGG